MHFILYGPHTSLHTFNHIHYKKLQYDFPKMKGVKGSFGDATRPKLKQYETDQVVHSNVIFLSSPVIINTTLLSSLDWPQLEFLCHHSTSTSNIPGGILRSSLTHSLSWNIWFSVGYLLMLRSFSNLAAERVPSTEWLLHDDCLQCRVLQIGGLVI